MNKKSEALIDYSKSIELNPSDDYSYVQRGIIKLNLKASEEAIEDFDRAILINENNILAYFYRAQAKKALGRDEEASNDYAIYEKLAYKSTDDDERENRNLKNEKIEKRNDSSKTWMVSIGISQYQFDSHMSPLSSPVRNAYDFARIFERNNAVNHDIPILSNEKAVKDSIISISKSVFSSKQVGKEDMIIFYFSGHGMILNDAIGICPYEYMDPRSLITDQELIEIMKLSPAKYKVCIIEACKNNVRLMSSLSSLTLEKLEEKRKNIGDNIIYITSTQTGAYSYEYSETGSVFSYFLLKGIRGAADFDADNIITITEIFEYSKSKVVDYTNGTQIPQINLAGYRNIPIIKLNDR